VGACPHPTQCCLAGPFFPLELYHELDPKGRANSSGKKGKQKALALFVLKWSLVGVGRPFRGLPQQDPRPRTISSSRLRREDPPPRASTSLSWWRRDHLRWSLGGGRWVHAPNERNISVGKQEKYFELGDWSPNELLFSNTYVSCS